MKTFIQIPGLLVFAFVFQFQFQALAQEKMQDLISCGNRPESYTLGIKNNEFVIEIKKGKEVKLTPSGEGGAVTMIETEDPVYVPVKVTSKIYPKAAADSRDPMDPSKNTHAVCRISVEENGKTRWFDVPMNERKSMSEPNGPGRFDKYKKDLRDLKNLLAGARLNHAPGESLPFKGQELACRFGDLKDSKISISAMIKRCVLPNPETIDDTLPEWFHASKDYDCKYSGEAVKGLAKTLWISSKAGAERNVCVVPTKCIKKSSAKASWPQEYDHFVACLPDYAGNCTKSYNACAGDYNVKFIDPFKTAERANLPRPPAVKKSGAK